MASGLSFSSIRPHAASVCRTCGKEVHSSLCTLATCRRVSVALADSAMRRACAKALALASEKSVGWTIERISHTACPHCSGSFQQIGIIELCSRATSITTQEFPDVCGASELDRGEEAQGMGRRQSRTLRGILPLVTIGLQGRDDARGF